MTLNPNCAELRAALDAGQQPASNPFAVTRVFKCKLDQLMKLLERDFFFSSVTHSLELGCAGIRSRATS